MKNCYNRAIVSLFNILYNKNGNCLYLLWVDRIWWLISNLPTHNCIQYWEIVHCFQYIELNVKFRQNLSICFVQVILISDYGHLMTNVWLTNLTKKLLETPWRLHNNFVRQLPYFEFISSIIIKAILKKCWQLIKKSP